MSVLRCQRCGDLIDTDEDMEAYIPARDLWLCPECRESFGITEDDYEEPKPERVPSPREAEEAYRADRRVARWKGLET